MIPANNPKLKSWVPASAESDFPIQNLPFGVYQTSSSGPRLCTAIGDFVADLKILADHGFFDDLELDKSVLEQPTLNAFIAQGPEKTRAVRNRLSEILDDNLDDWDASELAEFFLVPRDAAEMLLPLHIGDYTDFYSSLEHASNVGAMFRDPKNPLLPNWRHLPVAYHGRASSIVVSGTPIRRPKGQIMPKDAAQPVFSPSQMLDFELEMAFVIGQNTQPGEAIPAARAEEYIFGLVLFNDWSARDIQRWEYVPLGPFLSKNFASTISPWVITLDALEPFRVPGPNQEPEVLPYLRTEGSKNLDIHLEVELQTAQGVKKTICRSNTKYLYWNMSQQLAHHTVNGCNVHIGDLCASGTISGPEPGAQGCLLELTQGGAQPVALPDGAERRFLEDGDTIILRGFAQKDGVRIGFGEAAGAILPSTT